jgi:hypothetical protein
MHHSTAGHVGLSAAELVPAVLVMGEQEMGQSSSATESAGLAIEAVQWAYWRTIHSSFEQVAWQTRRRHGPPASGAALFA